HGAFDRAERVDVLRLRAGAQGSLGALPQGHVDVGADVALFHAGFGDVEGAEDVPQGSHIGGGHLGGPLPCPGDRVGDDLHARTTGAVVVDEGMVGTLDAAGRPTHVGVLSGVFLHVGALDGDGDDGTVLELD